MSTPPTLPSLLTLPQVLAGFLGCLNPREIQGKTSPQKISQGWGGEQNPAGESRPCQGCSASFHQKSPPSLYPGLSLAGIVSSPAAEFPFGLRANPEVSSGSHGDLGGGSRGGRAEPWAGAAVFGELFGPPWAFQLCQNSLGGRRDALGGGTEGFWRCCSHPPSLLRDFKGGSPLERGSASSKSHLREGSPGGFGVCGGRCGRGWGGSGAVPAPTAPLGCSGGCGWARLAWP